jgi:NAD(P)H-dependent FMN reductase
MYKEHPKGHAPDVLERLATLYRAADGFMIVSAEYNNSIPPALSNLLDYFLEEYFFRPSAICCYSAGRYGGVRAAMQLRAMLAELGMPSIPSLLPVGAAQNVLAEDGSVLDEKALSGTARFLDEFEWYARALASARVAGTPY